MLRIVYFQSSQLGRGEEARTVGGGDERGGRRGHTEHGSPPVCLPLGSVCLPLTSGVMLSNSTVSSDVSSLYLFFTVPASDWSTKELEGCLTSLLKNCIYNFIYFIKITVTRYLWLVIFYLIPYI